MAGASLQHGLPAGADCHRTRHELNGNDQMNLGGRSFFNSKKQGNGRPGALKVDTLMMSALGTRR
ncbi:MAG: hypothetical protein K8F62_10705 [Pseudorhodoplanes sp.]|nr:hypothetical protein [Pseudorhodoplanes sp.]